MVDDRRVKLPNFLIVGAAKSGTTSLYHYLNQHPEIFMSKIKEPSFLSSQFTNFKPKNATDARYHKIAVKNLEDYRRLFADAKKEKAVGEASTDSLYFQEKAIKRIKLFLGSPSIIIILRNPVDRAFSAYTYLVRENAESFSFEEALAEDEIRMREGWSCTWFYKSRGFYYKPVKAYLESFDKVKVCLYDDLLRDPVLLAREIYAFLGVDSSFGPDTSTKYNVSGIPWFKPMNNFFVRSGQLQRVIRVIGHLTLGEDNWIRLRESIRPTLLVKTKMKAETRKFLEDIYREDILKLQALIGRDLSDWMSN